MAMATVRGQRRICLHHCLLFALVFVVIVLTWSPSFFDEPQWENDEPLMYNLTNIRERIALEMTNYGFPDGKYGISAKRLEDLVPEAGGNPMRSVIMTTWRSGSTFMGELISSHPSTFYHFEPLLPWKDEQIGEESPYAEEALSSLQHLLHCDFKGLSTRYNNYVSVQTNEATMLRRYNYRLWNACGEDHKLCWEPDFLTRFCRLFPFQAMKVIRLRISLAAKLLEDDSLNVRMILLVRDPRGTMNSRWEMGWCNVNKLCTNPSQLCSDLVKDYWAARELRSLHPQKFRALRYEDLSTNIRDSTTSLFDFLGLSQVDGTLHPDVLHFLDTHTNVTKPGEMSTFKNTQKAPLRWLSRLTKNQIHNIQSKCREAMYLWGYKVMESEEISEMLSKPNQTEGFNPVGDLIWN